MQAGRHAYWVGAGGNARSEPQGTPKRNCERPCASHSSAHPVVAQRTSMHFNHLTHSQSRNLVELSFGAGKAVCDCVCVCVPTCGYLYLMSEWANSFLLENEKYFSLPSFLAASPTS